MGLTEEFKELVIRSRGIRDGYGDLAADVESLMAKVMHTLEYAYGLLFYDDPDGAMEIIKQVLTHEEQDAGIDMINPDDLPGKDEE